MHKTPILQWLQFPTDTTQSEGLVPSHRHKLATCLHRGAIYMYGGVSKTKPCKDLYRYDIELRRWFELKGSGDAPPALQGHTMAGYKNSLYVFGGDFQYGGSAEDVSLWKYDILAQHWHKYTPHHAEVSLPLSRRGHTMVHYSRHLFIYGGYVDLKGSSSELWSYDLESESWRLEYSTVDEVGPAARHGHTAVVYDHAMWLCGGMTHLQPKQDMWRWHFGVRQWHKVKCKQSPPADLYDHSAVVVNDCMLVYGGAKTEQLPAVWLFHFDTLNWQKMSCGGVALNVTSQHCAILVDHMICSSERANRATSEPQLPNKNKIVQQRRPQSSPAIVTCDRKSSASFASNRVLPVSGELCKTTKTQMLQSRQLVNANRSDVCRFNTNETTASVIQYPSGTKGLVLKGIESYKEFAKDLIVNERDDRMYYSRQSSTNPDAALKMKQIKRINSRMSSSCDSVNQGYHPADNVLLLRSRSKTMGNVSLNSQSGCDNPTFLNSSGNSSDCNTSQIRRISNDSSDWWHSTDTLPYVTDDSHIPLAHLSKLRRVDNGRYNQNVKPDKLRLVSRVKKRQHAVNRCVSVDSILESAFDVSNETKLNSKHASSHRELSLNFSSNFSLPGSTENLEIIPQIRCVKKTDLIVEDIEDFDLESKYDLEPSMAETSFSPLLARISGDGKVKFGLVNEGIDFQEHFAEEEYQTGEYKRSSQLVYGEREVPIDSNSEYQYVYDARNDRENSTEHNTVVNGARFENISALGQAIGSNEPRSTCAEFELQPLTAISTCSSRCSQNVNNFNSKSDKFCSISDFAKQRNFQFSKLPSHNDDDDDHHHRSGQADFNSEHNNQSGENKAVGNVSAAYTNQVYFESVTDERGFGAAQCSSTTAEELTTLPHTNCDTQTAHTHMRSILASHLVENTSGERVEISDLRDMKAPQSNRFVMIILGGKEQTAAAFTTRPLSMCQLDIQF